MPARIIPRAAWGARRPKTIPITVPITARSATCVHHAGATPVNVHTVAQAYAYVRADQDYHMDSNGWNDIGYNYLVISSPGTPADGMILEGRGRDVLGAHCLGSNQPWIGVQVATGGTAARGDQRPSSAALASVRWLHDGFGIAARHNLGMKAHSDGFATECPGPILLAWVRSGMPATAQSGSGSPWPSPAKPPAPTKQPTGQLKVDGILGHNTISRWQQVMGTPVDGVISPVSSLVKAVQARLNREGAGLHVDGVGIVQDGQVYKTVAAMQRHLRTPIDGRLSRPSMAVEAVQSRLNSNTF